MKTHIFAVRGLAGAGKSTACDILSDLHACPIVSVADHLKTICAYIFHLDADHLYGSDGQKAHVPTCSEGAARCRASDPVTTHMVRQLARSSVEYDLLRYSLPQYASECVRGRMSVREIMQHIGTAWGRERAVSRDVWVAELLRRLESSYHACVVVDSVRFHDEVMLLHAQGATILRIERAGVSVGDHESEQAVLRRHPSEIIIQNNGSEFDLRRALEEATT